VRPTPAETLAGIAAILRTTIAPAVGDAHARSQLHQIVTVLAQLQVHDPIGDLRHADAGLRTLLTTCLAWVDEDPRRPGLVERLAVTEAADDTFEAVAGAHVANRGALERFILQLRAWRLEHGIDDSHDLDAAIAAHLSGDHP
jgi:hypothetical protein